MKVAKAKCHVVRTIAEWVRTDIQLEIGDMHTEAWSVSFFRSKMVWPTY